MILKTDDPERGPTENGGPAFFVHTGESDGQDQRRQTLLCLLFLTLYRYIRSSASLRALSRLICL